MGNPHPRDHGRHVPMGDPQGCCGNQDLRVFPDVRSNRDSWPFSISDRQPVRHP